MPENLTLLFAFVLTLSGLAWFALSIDAHWRQLRGSTNRARSVVVGLRVAGSVALFASLLLCLRADHGSMASLVWVMLLAAGALAIAFTLAWRPAWLAPFAWPFSGSPIRPSSTDRRAPRALRAPDPPAAARCRASRDNVPRRLK
ncbi:MAG: DUF3325 domain-containing protein [Steroidobacteraceae bacterium]